MPPLPNTDATSERQLRLEFHLPWSHLARVAKDQITREIPWACYPELAALCWNRHTPHVSLKTALRLYEDNWPFVNKTLMSPEEKKLVNGLAARFGSFLHV